MGSYASAQNEMHTFQQNICRDQYNMGVMALLIIGALTFKTIQLLFSLQVSLVKTLQDGILHLK